MFRKIVFIFLIFGLFGVSYFYIKSNFSRIQKPNVILISIDSLRVDHVGVFGYSKGTTPNIDLLAQQSFVYTNYFSTSFITPISEASVHTGLYPMRNGMISFGHVIDKEVPVLAEIMKKNGYATLAIGNSPEFNVYAPGQSFLRGFDFFKCERLRDKEPMSFQMIENQLAKKKDGNFIWVHLGNAHAPFTKVAGANFIDPGYNGFFNRYSFRGNANYYYDQKIYKRTQANQIQYFGTSLLVDKTDQTKEINKTIDVQDINFGRSSDVSVRREDIEHIVNAYDEGVWSADREVSRIISLLKEFGVYENSVVIVQSEHGEDLNEHKVIGHYDIFDTTTHVPLIFKPAGVPPGPMRRISALVSGVDIFPSLLKYLGLNSGIKTDGRNTIFSDFGSLDQSKDVFITRTPLWETLLEVRDNPFFDQIRKENQFGMYADFAIRNQKWKVIHRRSRLILSRFSLWKFLTKKDVGAPLFELFDVENDPYEQNSLDLWSVEALTLKERLQKWERSQFDETPTGRTIYQPQEYR